MLSDRMAFEINRYFILSSRLPIEFETGMTGRSFARWRSGLENMFAEYPQYYCYRNNLLQHRG